MRNAATSLPLPLAATTAPTRPLVAWLTRRLQAIGIISSILASPAASADAEVEADSDILFEYHNPTLGVAELSGGGR